MLSRRSGSTVAARQLVIALLLTCVCIAGCSEGMSGTYAEPSGVGSLEFRSNGTVYVEMLGMTFVGKYRVDDDRVIITGPNGSQVYTLDGDRLENGMGMVFVKQ